MTTSLTETSAIRLLLQAIYCELRHSNDAGASDEGAVRAALFRVMSEQRPQ